MLASVALGSVLALAATTVAAPPPPPIDVRGDADCPTASQVGAALVGMLAPPAVPGGPRDVVEVRGRGGAVTLTLLDPAGAVIAERVLPRSPSCPERAQAAAVIVAAWEVRLRAGAQPSLPSLPSAPSPSSTAPPAFAAASPPSVMTAPPPVSGPAPPPVSPAASIGASPASALPAPASPAPAPPAPAPAPPAARPPEALAAVAAPAREAPPPIDVGVGAAIMASVAAGGVSPAAMLEASVGRRGSPFALAIGALAVGTHDTAVGPGRGTWRRFGGIVDLRSISRWQALALEVHAGLALTAVGVTGQSLPVTSGTTLFDPGGLAGLRLRFRLGRLAPWVETTAAFWPRTHNLYVGGSAASAELPAFEALLGVGVAQSADR